MMTDTLRADLAIDKSKWKRVQLGDVVEESREVVRDPVKEGIERVVGLEHIDSESIHLKRWDTLEQSTTFTKKFTKGQVLFGRRRAYLKKAALSTFNGICSGDITVLQAKPDLIPELLPFLINNDKFFGYAVKNSAGSLSPRAKFKDLANYEFLLPPKDQQARLAELLWVVNNVYEYDLNCLQSAQILRDATLLEHFTHPQLSPGNSFKSTELGWIPPNWEVVKQGEVAEFVNGRAYKKEEWEHSGTPVIRLQNLTGSGNSYYFSNLSLPEKQYCSYGDLLYMWSASFGAVIWQGEKAIFHYHIWKINCDHSRLDKMYMYFNLEQVTKRMMRQRNGSTMPHVTKDGMEKLKIALPPLHEQQNFVEKMIQIEKTLESIKKRLDSSKQLQKSLVNKIF